MLHARSIVNLVKPNSQKFAGWLLAKTTLPAISATSYRNYNVPVTAEPFLSGSSSTYIEDMYNAWLQDPSSVHAVSIVFMPLIMFV